MAQVDASIACPLILSEIYRDMALGVQNFVLSDFPQSLKQAPADASGCQRRQLGGDLAHLWVSLEI